MKKALYEVVDGYAYGRLTPEGAKIWGDFIDMLKWAIGISFFDDADDGEIADLFSEAYPRLCKKDIYNAVVSARA